MFPISCVALHCGAFLPPEAFILRISLTLTDNAHESENAAALSTSRRSPPGLTRSTALLLKSRSRLRAARSASIRIGSTQALRHKIRWILGGMENISENVAAASGSSPDPAKSLVSLWRNSKAHNAKMIGPWTHSGLGVVVDAYGMVFATQRFATVSRSQLFLRERFNRF